MTRETEFEIISKKIIAKFFKNSLFTRLAIGDYEGLITGIGDKVQMADHTMLTINREIIIGEERDSAIFEDIMMIDLVTTRIAKELKDVVEEVILKTDASNMVTHDDLILMGKEPPKHVHGRLYFACQVVPVGGFEPKGYGIKFVYGFKIG